MSHYDGYAWRQAYRETVLYQGRRFAKAMRTAGKAIWVPLAADLRLTIVEGLNRLLGGKGE